MTTANITREGQAAEGQGMEKLGGVGEEWLEGNGGCCQKAQLGFPSDGAEGVTAITRTLFYSALLSR